MGGVKVLQGELCAWRWRRWRMGRWDGGWGGREEF